VFGVNETSALRVNLFAALTPGSVPTTVMRTLTRNTQKPVSSL
jgi:hypothetical protein